MTWTTTIDARPHVMGNMMMVTGTFLSDSGDTGGDIVLTNVLSSIVAAGANANAAGATDTEIDGTASATLTLVTGANLGGTWWALGNRS